MKSTPILMNQEMIRAYMAGRKTQTRRIVKSGPPIGFSSTSKLVWIDHTKLLKKRGKLVEVHSPGWYWSDDKAICGAINGPIKCPYGQPGDELWFRETFRHTAKISDIRVERVQGISEADARAEGAGFVVSDCSQTYREDFKELWESINGKKTGRLWADNPLVWVVEFERYI